MEKFICSHCGKEIKEAIVVELGKKNGDIKHYHLKCFDHVKDENNFQTIIDLFVDDFTPVAKEFLAKNLSVENFGKIVSKLLSRHFAGIKKQESYPKKDIGNLISDLQNVFNSYFN